MFVAVGPMFNLVRLGYWGLAGRLFDLRQAKRLFGLVGAGEELSTIVALFSTPLLIRAIGEPTHLVAARRGGPRRIVRDGRVHDLALPRQPAHAG